MTLRKASSWRAAKHVSFANGDFVEKQPQLRVAVSADREILQIFAGVLALTALMRRAQREARR